MNSVQMIEELVSAFGAPGFEDDVINVAQKYVPQGYKTRRDSMLNFYIEAGASEKPVVVLDAHTDEVGLMVQAVRKNGTLVVAPLGNWVPATLYGQRMMIKNLDNKYITGVIASPMYHFGGGENETLSIEGLALDVGASSADEVSEVFRIAPGCPITPKVVFERHGDLMFAKAFDDRIGCAVVLDVLNRISGEELSVNVTGVLTSQEEVGYRGAAVAARSVNADVAICFEGAPADDTLLEPHMAQTVMGKGPMLRFMDSDMIANPRFMRFALEVAKKLGIPVQQAVRTRSGTNGTAFHLSNKGVPTIVISTPVRYVHSANSIASLNDYHKTVDFAAEIVKSLNPVIIEGF